MTILFNKLWLKITQAVQFFGLNRKKNSQHGQIMYSPENPAEKKITCNTNLFIRTQDQLVEIILCWECVLLSLCNILSLSLI